MGKLTIKEILNFTNQTPEFRNRFFFRERDVLRSIKIQRIKSFDPFNPTEPPKVFYKILSSSYPNYGKFLKIRSKGATRQRQIKHQYDIILQMDELSINTTEWTTYLGSQKEIRLAPQSDIKSIRHSTLKQWKKQAERKFKKKKDQADWIRKRKEQHRKSAKYLDQGDWLSRVLQINMDWRMRFEWVFAFYGHCYYTPKANRPPVAKHTNPNKIPAFTKHHLNLIEILLKMGKLST